MIGDLLLGSIKIFGWPIFFRRGRIHEPRGHEDVEKPPEPWSYSSNQTISIDMALGLGAKATPDCPTQRRDLQLTDGPASRYRVETS